MADTKISALTSATTPLAGTEVLPIVQGGTTVKVSAANITAGRAVSASSLSTGTTDVFAKVGTQLSGGNAILSRFNASNKPTGIYTGGSSGESFIGANLNWSSGNVFNYQLNGMMWYMGDPGGGGSSVVLGVATGTAGNTAGVDDASTVKFRWGTDGNYTLVNGNLVIGTSGKGIDFSATSGSGTSELLADYEEGTWTPVVSDGTTDVSMAAGAGWYVKVGKVVTVGWNSYYLDISTLGALVQVRIKSLPFTAAAQDTWSSANFPFDNVGKNYCQRIPASGTNLFFFVTQASAGDFAECTRTTLGGTAVSFFGSMTYFSA
jgi:hypothetical protein